MVNERVDNVRLDLFCSFCPGIEQGKDNIQGRTGQETLNPALVAHPLHDIARHFGIKKAHRQTHQLNQKISENRYIDPCTDVQQYPGTDKIYTRAPQKKHDLRNQDHIYNMMFGNHT